MRRTSLAGVRCSISRTVEIVGEWWTPLVLRDLFAGIARFDDLQRDLGIATNVLADRLSHLVEHGVVERRRYSSHPGRFEYHLTDKGRELYPILLALVAWGDRHTTGGAGPPVEVVHRSCGKSTTAVPHCARCGGPLALEDLELRAGPGGRRGPGTWLLGDHLAPPLGGRKASRVE